MGRGEPYLVALLVEEDEIWRRSSWPPDRAPLSLSDRFLSRGVCGCERFSSSSIGDVFRTIIKRDGYVGLMRGWKPRMLFHAPAAAICWSTYEASKSFFERFNEKRRK